MLKKLLISLLACSLMVWLFVPNAFAMSQYEFKSATTGTDIQVIKEDAFPAIVDQILMDNILISESEKIATEVLSQFVSSKEDVVEKITQAQIQEPSTQVSVEKNENHSTLIDITNDENLKRLGIKADSDTKVYASDNYLYVSTFKDDVLSQWMFFLNGNIRKNVSYILDGITYIICNENNISIKKSDSLEYARTDTLTNEQLQQFRDAVDKGYVVEKEEFSFEDVKSYLESINSYQDISSSSSNIENSNSAVALQSTYAAASCIAYAPGGNYTSNAATKPISAYYIGTYCTTISGLSVYNNGSNVAQIREYDTRKSYTIGSTNTIDFFGIGADVMSIVAVTQLALNPVLDALAIAGVIIDIGGRLTASTDFVAEREYAVSAYRESQIYDYTQEHAYVELPQMYSTMAIGIVYSGYSGGVYTNASWQVISLPQFNIPSLGITNASFQQYSYYVSDNYYRNCVIYGKWLNGRNAYGGLGG